MNDADGLRASLRRPLPKFVGGGTSARLASDASVPLGRGAVALALALLLTAALASLARGDSHPAPTNVSVAPGKPGVANTVTWTASTGADGYRIQWKSGAQDWDPINRQASVTGGSTTTGYIFGVSSGIVHTVRVGATKGTEAPSWSDTTTFVPLFGCDGATAVHVPSRQFPVAGPNNDLIDDCETLLSVATTLDPNDILNWSTTRAMTSWNGITLRTSSTPYRVNDVQLNNGVGGAKLQGGIPPLIANLTQLNRLDLSYNDLTGTIPSEMQTMTSLSWLTLTANSLSGPCMFPGPWKVQGVS